jgi:nucleoid-associated protein YgaU
MVVVALVLTALLVWAGGPAGAGAERVPVRTYTVHADDTLWRIAQRYAQPGRDLRPVVDAIADANDVDPGSITPGLVLTIPADLG